MKFLVLFGTAATMILLLSNCSPKVSNDVDSFLLSKDKTKEAVQQKEYIGKWKFLRVHALKDECLYNCPEQIDEIRERLEGDGTQYKDTKILTITKDTISVLKAGDGHFFNDVMPLPYIIAEDDIAMYFEVIDTSKRHNELIRIFLLTKNKIVIHRSWGESYIADEFYR